MDCPHVRCSESELGGGTESRRFSWHLPKVLIRAVCEELDLVLPGDFPGVNDASLCRLQINLQHQPKSSL